MTGTTIEIGETVEIIATTTTTEKIAGTIDVEIIGEVAVEIDLSRPISRTKDGEIHAILKDKTITETSHKGSSIKMKFRPKMTFSSLIKTTKIVKRISQSRLCNRMQFMTILLN